MKLLLKNTLRDVKIVRFLYLLKTAFGYYRNIFVLVIKKSWKSNELSTFSYSITTKNVKYLSHTLSIVANTDFDIVYKYFDELYSNEKLKSFELNGRILNYVLIRLFKPRVVVENGIFIGLNSLIMCEAIKKNIEEGYEGVFIGLDIDGMAGDLIRRENYKFVKIVISDAIDFLNENLIQIDYYFSDGDRRKEYELVEFEMLKKSLGNSSVIVSNKLAFSDALADFSMANGRKLVIYKEDVLDHWYPGTLFGISY